MNYLEKYFENILKVTRPQIKALIKKRDKIKIILKKNNLKYLPGTSTFYFLINIEKYLGTSTDFALNMLKKHRIAVVPGSAYGNSTKRFIRVGFGTESIERIEQALVLIAKEISLKN